MRSLAAQMVQLLVEEYGRSEFLRRISSPYWFQCLGCVLGYDWHSSGVTTVTTAVLRDALSEIDVGIYCCGGKGKRSLLTLEELERIGVEAGLSDSSIEKLKYASRMSAKVDNALVQDGYELYHHTIFFTEEGDWAVVQQGMCPQDKTARRYHWLSKGVSSFVVTPHSGIAGERVKECVLDMTAKESLECQRVCVDLVNEGVDRLARDVRVVRDREQQLLDKWVSSEEVLVLPWRVNWDALKRAYEIKPRTYEELVSFSGIGPRTIRGLALIAELLYGAPPSWKDPVKFSFAFGGKDGVPFPVDKKSMDEVISVLQDIVKQLRIDEARRENILKTLLRLSTR